MTKRKNVLVLHNKDGYIKTVRWGDAPGEWHVPDYYKIDAHGFTEDNEGAISSTWGKRIFVLVAKMMEGRLWWKKIYAHYIEEGSEKSLPEIMADWREFKKSR